MIYSGMGPDARILVRKARKQAQLYYKTYNERIPVAQLVREVATVMQEFTRKFTHASPIPLHPRNRKGAGVLGAVDDLTRNIHSSSSSSLFHRSFAHYSQSPAACVPLVCRF